MAKIKKKVMVKHENLSICIYNKFMHLVVKFQLISSIWNYLNGKVYILPALRNTIN